MQRRKKFINWKIKIVLTLFLLLTASVVTLKFTVRRTIAMERVSQTTDPQKEQLIPANPQAVASNNEIEKVIVNCPVLEPDAQEVIISIGNMGEDTIYYNSNLKLQLQIHGIWYEMPKSSNADDNNEDKRNSLQGGMAMDETLDLTQYDITDYKQNYRVVVEVNDSFLCAEFSYKDAAEVLKENLPESLTEEKVNEKQ